MALTKEEQELVIKVTGQADVSRLTALLEQEERTLRELIAAKSQGAITDAAYQAQVEESRRILGTFTDGGEPARGLPGRSSRPRNVRWIVVHMVEEYARHLDHADLLRERIDGRVGQ